MFTKRIILFGSNGMLGNYILHYFNTVNFNIIPLTRNDFNIINADYEALKRFLIPLIKPTDCIINCSGIIKQRNFNITEMISVNSIFPNLLAQIKHELHCNVIHVTTDCVFNGLSGNYNENSYHDCFDVYGKSKSLGENLYNTNIRTSIIGEEKYNKHSLLEWVKQNKDKNIQGYVNHMWNGVTCLEFAKNIKTIIEEDNFWKGTRHLFSPTQISKYDLIKIINEIYDLNIKLEKNDNYHCNRVLNTIYTDLPKVKTELYNQILQQKYFLF